jgi:hypothetical protein
MKLTKDEKITIKIAKLLLKLDPETPDDPFGRIAREAAYMANRIHKGWGPLPGRPHFNGIIKKVKP